MAARSRQGNKLVDPDQLWSFLAALHNELERQSKDRSSPALSDLALEQTNRAIVDTKQIADAVDPFVASLKPFVAAGDNPSVNDALLVLGILQNALNRIISRGR